MTEVLTVLNALRNAQADMSELTDGLANSMVELNGSFDPETGEIRVGIQEQVDRALDLALIELEERCLKEGVKLPPADLRKARVTQLVRRNLGADYDRFLGVQANVEMFKRKIRNRETEISAAQSILRGER